MDLLQGFRTATFLFEFSVNCMLTSIFSVLRALRPPLTEQLYFLWSRDHPQCGDSSASVVILVPPL